MPKRPSLTVGAVLVGGGVALTGIGQNQLNQLYAGVQAIAAKAGITTKVDGTTILGVLLALAALAAIMPNVVGRPLNNLLARYNLRL